MRKYRKPGIPPDLTRGPEIQSSANALPDLWHHVFTKIRELHAKGITGKGVKIGISDTGYRPHPLLPTPLALKDFTRSSSGTMDNNGHQSHCNGICLGRRDENGTALGIAPDAELIVAKVLGDSGSGSTTGINAGRIWLAEQGAEVISESLGDGGGPPLQEDIRSFESAYEKGVHICVAALGNAGFNGVGRPGSYPHNCGVAALRENGSRADYSSVGDPADLAAPGSNIVSCGLKNNLVSMSGTSMATPLVAGLLALVIQYRQQIGLPALIGYKAWREFWKDPRFVADAGKPGHDPEYGYGIPQMTKIVEWMLDPVGV